MRKLLLTTAAIAAAIGLAVAGEPSFGTYTDLRDGKIYRTVKMPDGKTWMAWNLNYLTDSSWCYENSADSCDKYGRLYTWNEAMTVCPAGYHLPSHEEWDDLMIAAGGRSVAGKRLKTKKSGWNQNGNGTNDFGFSALPGGNRMGKNVVNSGGYFGNVGDVGFWWIASDYSGHPSRSEFAKLMYYFDNGVGENLYHTSSGLSVRCVIDRPIYLDF
jgi:uncharacterized protein (TIGR02145 family)